jgi:polyphenol oxidase
VTPYWPLPAGVRSACSERAGGVSAPPWDSLNLGDHVGDDPLAVAENRRRFQQSLQARPVFLKQVHGRGVLRLDAHTHDGEEADACWTTERGLACTMMVADCLPVLISDGAVRIVGAAHCGWRGLAGGVLEALCQEMRAAGGEALRAWLGPCIGPDAFEVGVDVRAAFTQHDASAAELFRPHGQGKFLADLPGLARRRLDSLGIDQLYGNDGTGAWCTVSNPSRFFSHRRDRVSGRFAASIWRS